MCVGLCLRAKGDCPRWRGWTSRLSSSNGQSPHAGPDTHAPELGPLAALVKSGGVRLGHRITLRTLEGSGVLRKNRQTPQEATEPTLTA